MAIVIAPYQVPAPTRKSDNPVHQTNFCNIIYASILI
jgi:hypothetical protein